MSRKPVLNLPVIMGMDLKPVSLDDIEIIYQYTSLYGEGCCQHSPVSMWSLYEKYGDSFCIQDGFLYVCREHLCDDGYRVYLAPFGAGDIAGAFENILSDAHSHGKKAKFITLTEKYVNILNGSFPDKFECINDRDLAEYIISTETMRDFPGKIHARRRTEIRSFWRDFGDRTEVSEMTAGDREEVLDYASEWVEKYSETHDEEALERELKCIQKQIWNYDKLGISGTVIRIDGNVKAFCYGVGLNDDYYDVLIEKGDREYPGIYRVLRQESTKLNVTGYKYVNFEEDVGVPGLRRLKESYGPEFLIGKYRVTEK